MNYNKVKIEIFKILFYIVCMFFLFRYDRINYAETSFPYVIAIKFNPLRLFNFIINLNWTWDLSYCQAHIDRRDEASFMLFEFNILIAQLICGISFMPMTYLWTCLNTFLAFIDTSFWSFLFKTKYGIPLSNRKHLGPSFNWSYHFILWIFESKMTSCTGLSIWLVCILVLYINNGLNSNLRYSRWNYWISILHFTVDNLTALLRVGIHKGIFPRNFRWKVD